MDKKPQTTEKESVQLPLVALVGPTNAGKSTLFNRLTGSWQAITAREESTTRDRIYGEVEWQGHKFNIVDTGGFIETDNSHFSAPTRTNEPESEEKELYKKIKSQTLQAVEEADIILFVYDVTLGISVADKKFINNVRKDKNIWLIANKVDSQERREQLEDYQFLGLPTAQISSISGKGVGDLLELLTDQFPASIPNIPRQLIVALIGRPNVGKSTLLNALTQSDRAVVSPVAGTTRDIVTGELTIDGKKYLLADTAGVRRRGRITRGPEDFSVKRTLAAISQAAAVLVLLDATEGTTRGDLHLIYFAHAMKKPVLIILNKIDLVQSKQVPYYRYLSKFDHVVISATKKENTEKVIDWIKAKVPV